MALRKQTRAEVEAAVKKYCGTSVIKTFSDVIIFISAYCPKCTVEEAVNIACWLREEGFVVRE